MEKKKLKGGGFKADKIKMAGSAGTSETPPRELYLRKLTLILRLRQVKQPVFVRRLTSFLCLLPDSILFGSPGSWYRICAFPCPILEG